MSTETLAAIWMLVGIVYALINGFVRKIDTGGDWLLPLAWITLWPMLLSILLISRVYQRITNQND